MAGLIVVVALLVLALFWAARGRLSQPEGRPVLKITVTKNVGQPTAAELAFRERLKQATALKRAGQWGDAVSTLQAAVADARPHGVEIDLATRIRVAQYLHGAGQRDTAWGEFNQLLIEASKFSPDRTVRPMIESEIYSKMALALQREERWVDYANVALLAQLSWMKGLSLQRRTEELARVSAPVAMADFLRDALAKTGRPGKLAEVQSVVTEALAKLDTVNLASVRRRVSALLV